MKKWIIRRVKRGKQILYWILGIEWLKEFERVFFRFVGEFDPLLPRT